MDFFCLKPHYSKERRLWKSEPRRDIISKLPDDVLHYIISFLSTRDAVRSSVLSKRWKFLWTSIPNIDLEDESNWRMEFDVKKTHIDSTFDSTGFLEDESNWRMEVDVKKNHIDSTFDSTGFLPPDTKFLEFVDRVITLHDASDIKRLRLMLCFPMRFPSLNSWLQVAINHNVKEIDLSLRSRRQVPLPCCLFNSQSLVMLNMYSMTLNPPLVTYLSNLKKLSLKMVTFSDDLSAQRLFSGCPVLDELVLIDFILKSGENITINVLTLKSLTVGFPPCIVNISSINLTYLSFSCTNIFNICLGELPSLDNAFIHLEEFEEPINGYGYHAATLFSGIYNVKVLKITCKFLWDCDFLFRSIFSMTDIMYYIPKLYQLIQLEVQQVSFPCYNYLMKFLTVTPRLEYLKLLQDICSNEVYEMLEMVPSCFNSSLKVFSISYFYGTRAEMDLLGFILRNATGLQRMIINCQRRLSKYEEALSLLPKVSENCVIEFRDSNSVID